MTPPQPTEPSLRRAIRFISNELQSSPSESLPKLVELAALKFDLNPNQAEYLQRFYRELGHRKDAVPEDD